MIHPERIREKMSEQKDVEQTDWVCGLAMFRFPSHFANHLQRIEPYGWDRHDRVYYVLDDNRIYRLTEPPRDTTQQKSKRTSQYGARRRMRKRQRVASSSEDEDDSGNNRHTSQPPEDDLVGGSWECIAITLQEARAFVETLVKTRDENEKILRKQLETHLLPILERQEEAMKRREIQRERDLLNLAKMANAKRSSRIADKAEKQKKELEEKEERRQRLAAERAEHQERLAQQKLQQERDFRMFARQRRMKERESRRIRHEAELAHLSEDSKHALEATRISERHLQAEIQRNRQALRDIEQEEEDWIFDCVCGLYGQVDDGTHSVACENCNVWQHSKCLGISEDEADQSEFHFICSSCRRREEEKNKSPKTIIKIKVRPSNASTTTSAEGNAALKVQHDPTTHKQQDRPLLDLRAKVQEDETQHQPVNVDLIEAQHQTTSAQPPTVNLRQVSAALPAAVEPLANASKVESLDTRGLMYEPGSRPISTSDPTAARQDAIGNMQSQTSSQSHLPTWKTKVPDNSGEALGSASPSRSKEWKSSILSFKHNGHSPLLQQSPATVTLAPHTKTTVAFEEAAVERHAQSLHDSLSRSTMSDPHSQGFVQTPTLPTDQHQNG